MRNKSNFTQQLRLYDTNTLNKTTFSGFLSFLLSIRFFFVIDSFVPLSFGFFEH